MSAGAAVPVLRFQYETLVRWPMQLIENRSVSHLDEHAPLRLAYEKVLVDFDTAAGHYLSDPDAEARAHELERRNRLPRIQLASATHRFHQVLEEEGRRRMERYRRVCEERRRDTTR